MRPGYGALFLLFAVAAASFWFGWLAHASGLLSPDVPEDRIVR